MNRRLSRFSSGARVALVGLFVLVQSCSSGSGGSEVGEATNVLPTARVQALNDGGTSTYREKSEVLLTGKDSEDGDGPPLSWSWRQVSGPDIELIEVNSTTVSFTAPDVSAETEMSFELTVEDSSGATDTASIGVTVVPADDADKFLSLDVRGATRNSFDTFEVVAALAEGASTGAMPAPFTLSARAYLVYPPRSAAPDTSCPVGALDFSAGIPATTPTGCFVELLEDLAPSPLPGGGTGFQGEWPANVPAVEREGGLTQEQLESEWWNTHFTLPVPRLDVADFNQQFVESGERGRLLDLFNVHRARIVLWLELTAPQNQSMATLIFNDLESAPVSLPESSAPKTLDTAAGKLVLNDGAGLPTAMTVPLEAILGGIPARESDISAQVYYRTVDPNGTRTTLNAWLEQAGFTSDDAGTLKPAAVAGEGEFAHAIYLNNYDLGFGRDMFTRTDEFGNVYSFVVNYATLEAAIRGVSPIVTVVMEYSPLADPADPDKFVKFFTFVDDGSGDSRRVTSMNFDGRGERFTPGNCVACHGGVKPPGLADLDFDETCGDPLDAVCYAWPARNAEDADVEAGDLQATFLPWDIESLLFADTDPAITEAPQRFNGISLEERLTGDYGDYSLGAQQEQLKKLNEAAYSTYCDAAVDESCVSDAARRLVEHWYGGVDANGSLTGSFDDSEAPPGWQNGELVADPQDPDMLVANPDDAAELYQEVYAQHCRMCHTNIFDPALRFDTYQKFAASASAVTDLVFERGIMPAARLTMDRLWVPQSAGPAPAAVLAEHLGVAEAQAGGPAPRAEITPAEPGTIERRTTFRFSARESIFADSFDWEVTYAPPAELAGAASVLGYEPTVTGDGTREVAFVSEHPGTYTANLVINDPPAGSAPPDELVDTKSVTVDNYVALACNDEGATTPGGEDVELSFLQNDRFAVFDSGATCADMGLRTLADGPDTPVTYAFSPAFDTSGQLTTGNGGTFTLNAAEACTLSTPAGCSDDTLTYTPNDTGGSYVDEISYTITDADGEVSNAGIVRVEVTADLVVTEGPVTDPISAPTDPSSAMRTNLVLNISGGAVGEIEGQRYTVTLLDAPNRGTVTREGVPLAFNSSFMTDNATETFVFESDEFEIGNERVEFRVADSDGTIASGIFLFEVLPQAPFATAAPRAGQLGTVMDQWTLGPLPDGKLDCTSSLCHGDPASTATDVFDLVGLDAEYIYGQLDSGTLGSVKVDRVNVEDSLILCYPSLSCGTTHTGGEALPVGSSSYDVIERWIREGAAQN